ncbi:glycosyltransferase family 2 protein [soil metagenome]
MIKLSLIIPVYNEELIITETLTKVVSFLKKKKYNWEIIIVDDGSKDKTVEIVNKLKIKNIIVESIKPNAGKGAAIRKGVEIANGQFIIFTDADLSVPIEFVDKFLTKLESGVDVVIGSRRIGGSKIIKHQDFMREHMGKVFTFLSRTVTQVYVSDFTCGFKGFELQAAKKIFSKSMVNRWVFDSEIMFLAHKFKYKIVEIPVEWVNREDSRINSLGIAGTESLIELFRIRLNDLAGKYD